ncbi:S1C family serine protease [Nocardiopsis sp. FIRDI 009]|uniref:S1C family serine protease n=1 Tax=Nocardiopsis sp. FIRDI 009 TaxID=714197 RepID=UPI001E290577|nr:trypsin-like peptidase domain-containing protein [Nocardiopsis sp. FIRDI 009]
MNPTPTPGPGDPSGPPAPPSPHPGQRDQAAASPYGQPAPGGTGQADPRPAQAAQGVQQQAPQVQRQAVQGPAGAPGQQAGQAQPNRPAQFTAADRQNPQTQGHQFHTQQVLAQPGLTGGQPPYQDGTGRHGRGVPAWMALAGMLVVALIAGGAGGVAGSAVSSSAAQEAAPEEEGPVMNEPPPEAPQRDPDTIAGVAQRVSPSVVYIGSADPGVSGGGSGFVIEGDYVVTNDHVSSVLEEDGIRIEYSDGSLSDATIVGADPSSDLAVLSLADPIDVEPLEFGDSEEVIVGDEVIAIGAPLGLQGTVTQGIISATDRPVSPEGENASRFYALQTDAAINPGNSGGPLVDLQGRVIGVNSMIVTMGGYMGEGSGNIGLGFAIPSSEAQNVVERLIANGSAAYADIGAELDLQSPRAGAVIAGGSDAVERGGPADEAGLEPGDVITSFDGRRVNSGQELLAMLRDLSPGDEVEVEYTRDGDAETTTIVLGSSTD